ncbi:MAG: hypothetical protein J6C07_09720 [Lachnospiraceae bacterium]|nr:hypothetical protein [Lachnospiraceae bacterium]
MLGLVASVVAMEQAGEMMDFLFGPSCIVDENGKIWGPEEVMGVFDTIFKKAMEKNPSLNIADSGKLQRSIITGHR